LEQHKLGYRCYDGVQGLPLHRRLAAPRQTFDKDISAGEDTMRIEESAHRLAGCP